MLHEIAVGAANFLFIGLKAFQQRNVIHNNRKAVVAVSTALAATEVYVIATIAREGWDVGLVLALGIGGGLGCLFAMTVHDRWFKRETADGPPHRSRDCRRCHAAAGRRLGP